MDYTCKPEKNSGQITDPESQVLQCISFINQREFFQESPNDDLRSIIESKDKMDVRELVTALIVIEWSIFSLSLLLNVYKSH